ncbi:MAG TPA: alpha/beta family hydrolase [Nitrospiraceae bacterium]|nr:alpha/beta family hydrolase [Nitrospiraceae bacterium]
MTTPTPSESRELTFRLSESAPDVEALLLRPADAGWLLVLAHGAGADMHHPFMETLARELAACRVATFRYQFSYMQHGRKRPDPPAVLTATVRAAVAAAEAGSDLPLLAGGKSLGGRMTSLALAEKPSSASGKAEAGTRVRGLVFFGFPLHQPGRPGTQRADHLERVTVPMLFLQGTRDTLADLTLMRPLCAKLGPRATLQTVDTADHSFHVLKRSGRTDADVLHQLARTVASWADALA